MKMKQIQLKKNSKNESEFAALKALAPKMLIIFGDSDEFGPQGLVKEIPAMFPDATIVGCSTAGEISNKGVYDNTVVVTGTHFDSDVKVIPVSETIRKMDDSLECGKRFAQKINREGLKAVFLLGPGLEINGSDVISGIRSVIGDSVALTGGLAGDGGKFQKTFTILNKDIKENAVVGVAIYGKELEITFGSMGGWEPFGPVRKVTRSKGNILYEIDGEPALDLYKKYLGDKAKDLPASGLLYPFALLKDNSDTTGLIRTILGIDAQEHSLILAGDIPQGGLVRLMNSTGKGLVNGAKGAAEETMKKASEEEGLAILISCVGRKIVMGQDVEDEVDAVRDVVGDSVITGFYSYGEICPQSGFSECKLHNQTMTITYLTEKRSAA
ncbi:MAG: FIST signal transduction protein [Bdellovibrio sp.]